MSQKRAASMAKIGAALENGLQKQTATEPVETPAVQIAPGVEAGAPIADAQFNDQAEEEEGAAEGELLSGKEELARAKEERERREEEKRQRDAFERTADATVGALRRVVRGTQIRLERLPQPGSIMLPFVLLLVFFLILIPINGHTRAVWSWLVLSGNARIGQTKPTEEAETPVGGSGVSGSDTPTITPHIMTTYVHVAEDY